VLIPMKSKLQIAIILAFVLLGVTAYLSRSIATSAQNAQDPYQTANQQAGEFPTRVNLDCAGCHGPGKKLPELGAEQFHKDSHGAMAASIHAKSGPTGKPAPSCLNCHAVNNDPTTILPAENPKSTVNRANMAVTCGGCHEEAGRTFHLSIHGSKRDQGATKPASPHRERSGL
jgi:Cytochrome c554 and c-prime